MFCDVGACDGDTIEDFIDFVDTYEKIYAFEPFANSAEILKNKQFAKIEVIEAAASDSRGKRDYLIHNYCDVPMITTISEGCENYKQITVDTVTIDDILSGKRASIIKMDVEGSEVAVLHGAEKTIKKHKPFLAICVYHKKEDLITIPAYIKSLVPEYKMYLRHCSKTAMDLVLFCKI